MHLRFLPATSFQCMCKSIILFYNINAATVKHLPL